ncbi:MAG: Amuc_1100 family pilus-like protein [Candidatus Synoicihabitans palmerolidicus]|nr:Amuc_1100 family pilus-like protein [Candidatus Synoicihabitans palmerolidicus]
MKKSDWQLSRDSWTGVVLTAILWIGAGWWTLHTKAEADRAAERLAARQMEWRALQASELAPVAAETGRQVASAEAAAKVLRRTLGVKTRDAIWTEEPPPQRADAFFKLAQFQERQREAAENAGVLIPEGMSWGFSAFANSGPDNAYLGVVHRQQLVVERLLNALWRAQPRELTRIQREPEQHKVARAHDAVDRVRPGGRADDYWEWKRERSVQRDGIVDTLAFRVGFVGKTGTLRRFLAEVRNEDVPVVVREVAVEPLGADGRAQGGVRSLAALFRDEEEAAGDTGDDGEEAVPIIVANEAEFLVTVEYLDFYGPRLAQAEESGGTP